MKLGVTATRAGLTPKQLTWFDEYIRSKITEITEFHHGDCFGGDAQLHRLVYLARNPRVGSNYPIKIVVHPCNLHEQRAYCKLKNTDMEMPERDPLRRNYDIVDATDRLLVFPKGLEEERRSGTWATYRYARKYSKPFVIVYPVEEGMSPSKHQGWLDSELLEEADERSLNSVESNMLDSMMKQSGYDPKTKKARYPLTVRQREWVIKLLDDRSAPTDSDEVD